MKPLDIAIICVVGVAFLASVGVIIYKKVTKKGGCDCGCDCCPHSCNCKNKK
ncbi:MAG: FeoB-associated Cys-rich membrane protein [Candidatus Coproplasma sp.]